MIKTAGAARSRMLCSSHSRKLAAIGSQISPARSQATRSTYNSTQLGNQQATTAPGSMPIASNPRASERLSSEAFRQLKDVRRSERASRSPRSRAWRPQPSANDVDRLPIARDTEGFEDIMVTHARQLRRQLAHDLHRVRRGKPHAHGRSHPQGLAVRERIRARIDDDDGVAQPVLARPRRQVHQDERDGDAFFELLSISNECLPNARALHRDLHAPFNKAWRASKLFIASS